MDTAYDGLYALASLDGAPLSPGDLATLGLPPGAGGFAAVARDCGIDRPVPAAYAFLGHLDAPAALAAALGRDPATPPGELLRAALARHGDDTPARAPGEWSFAAWDAETRMLTLIVSDTARDALLYATDGRRVAVAPHVRALRHVDRVDATPDGHALLLHMGRGPLRGTIGTRTILGHVHRVTAGTCVRISSAGARVGARAPLPAPTRWPGSFAEGMEALETVWRTILREQMTRHPNAAVMLSGGLDSSLIAAFAAAERGSGTLLALTSAAPPGSGMADEVEFARAVADRAGIALLPVAPPADADVYLPSPATLRWLQHPLASPRHYVYDALYGTAADRGASAILDGCGGESTLTGYPDHPDWRARLRSAARRLVRPERAEQLIDPAFHVRLSAHARDVAETRFRAELAAPPLADPAHARGDLWGYSPDIAKNLVSTTTTPLPALRNLLPFRDRRLVTLFARMPYAFIDHGGRARAPARALLAGMVPDTVRLRRGGRPFSPDYPDRIRRQAVRARTRLADFAAGGADEWLDLVWLDGALAHIASGADVSLDTVYEVQMTAAAAAFIADWRTGG